MIRPTINPKNEILLDNLIDDLPQSLLISGEVGVGIGTIAKYIASEIGAQIILVLPESKEKIDIEKGVIGVDSIRRLYNQTKTKTAIKRIIIIDYAERMGTRSQNAFLKLLEEPGDNTYFILVTHTPQKLLPTITSRVHSVTFLPINIKQSEKLLDDYGLTNATKRSQMLFMASGLPAEIIRLASDDDYFEARSSIIRDARDMLSGRTYNKLLIAHKYKDSRVDALTLLIDVGKILKRSINDNPSTAAIKRIDFALQAYQKIEGNANIRLCLARFVLQ
jgi:hypothetical protein